jgi:hypothetical protein
MKDQLFGKNQSFDTLFNKLGLSVQVIYIFSYFCSIVEMARRLLESFYVGGFFFARSFFQFLKIMRPCDSNSLPGVFVDHHSVKSFMIVAKKIQCKFLSMHIFL